MNLPNKLTLFRMFLVPVFLILVSVNQIPYNVTLATIVFSIAAYTDHLDGKIARRDNLITNFGKFMDPLADKLLVTSALIALVEYNLIGAWVAVVIIAREFAVSGLRTIAANEGVVIAASIWGKIKTTTQIIAIISMLIHLISTQEQYLMDLFQSVPFLESFFSIFPPVVMYVAVFFTIMSGLDYFKNGWKFIDTNK
ncbi:CDP-diacylglycerol--glycerol-3-phosphate 3-phosphatidyltransferase [Proteiniclasticum sp. C24MP]|uniref:CDP-diacylglycerol--glycerol-3-phosphate 3-phosphatidyltransferase n=1 Tax=Proteiniclasticum sp. C24MP TaxID=3374101 RepID=UPI0037542372